MTPAALDAIAKAWSKYRGVVFAPHDVRTMLDMAALEAVRQWDAQQQAASFAASLANCPDCGRFREHGHECQPVAQQQRQDARNAPAGYPGSGGHETGASGRENEGD